MAASETGRSGLRTWASASAIVASGPRITGSGRHHGAGGVLGVRHQPPDVLGLLGLHQLEQRGRGLGRQVGDQVGGVVGRHLLEDVGGALGVEVLEDLDLVLLGQLLEDVGEALVVHGGHHGGTPLGRQVVDHVGRVGGPHLVERRDQVGGALGLLAPGEPLDVAPLDDVGLAAAAQPLGRLLHRDPARAPSRGCGPAPSPRRRRCRSTPVPGIVTVRSSIWPITRVSVERCSKRRMLSSPVV